MKNYAQGHCIATAIDEGKDCDFTNEKPSALVMIPETGDDDDELLVAKSMNEAAKIEYQLNMERHNNKME